MKYKTRIDPLRFQAGGRRRRPNLALVLRLVGEVCALLNALLVMFVFVFH